MDHRAAWYWDGSVQAAVVTHLAASGWERLRVADTNSRERGVDIEARRDGESLLIEVKGYPSAVYTRGPRRGQPKEGNVGSQARGYFGGVVPTGLLLRAERPDARVVLALPRFVTYVNLAERRGPRCDVGRKATGPADQLMSLRLVTASAAAVNSAA